MAKLREFPPCKPDRAELDWDCGPCGQTRDSEALERANFDHAVECLAQVDAEGETWETVVWSHWACGWVEEIFTKPGTAAHELAVGMRKSLENYPSLDDDRWGQYEAEELEEAGDPEPEPSPDSPEDDNAV